MCLFVNQYVLQQHQSSVNPLQNVFWPAAITAATTGLILLADPPAHSFALKDYLVSFFVGLSIMSAQLFNPIACRYEKRPSVITPLISSAILWTFLYDILVTGSHPDLVNILGALIIFASIVLIAIFKGKPIPNAQTAEANVMPIKSTSDQKPANR